MIRVLLFALAAVFAANAGAATEILFWHALEGERGAQLDRLVTRFNSAQSDYKVVATYKGPYEETQRAAFAAYRAGGAPHIVQVYEAGGADMLAAKNAVRPLWQVMKEAGASLKTAAYIPALASYLSDSRGRMLALPFNSSTPVMFYNRDAFRKAGLDPAAPPKTWYEMIKTLGALANKGASCAFTTAWPSWVLLENMSAWHSQQFATRQNGMAGTDAELAFNSRLMVRWISMLSTWNKAGYFTYSGRGSEGEARFASGECAILTSSSAAHAGLKQRAGFDLGVAQMPYFDDFKEAPQNTLIGGAGLWVMGGHKRDGYKGVAKFVTYLSTAAVQAEWTRDTGYLPITADAFKLLKDQGFYTRNPGQEVAIRQMMHRKPTAESKGIRLGHFPRIRAIIDEEMERVWDGSKTPMDALNAAVARGNLLLNGFSKANGVALDTGAPRKGKRKQKKQ